MTDSRTGTCVQRPVIYQMLPRLYTNYCPNPIPGAPITVNGCGKFNAITDTVIHDIAGLGVTHMWYTGIIEHAHDADYTRYGIPHDNPHVIKGRAGSPYAITDYYDVDPDLAEHVPARMAEFEALVQRTHNAGLKVIIDFVPNHVGRQYRSDAAPEGVADLGANDNKEMFFSPDNNFYYITHQQFAPGEVYLGETGAADAYTEFPARASGNDCYTAFPSRNDWYDTVKLNYGVDPWNGSKHFDPIPDTWHKMLDIMLFWAGKGIDGMRCDMVHMVPVEFWHWAIAQVKKCFPHIIFIAEIYDVALYRQYIHYGGFDYLYDKVTMYDILRNIVCGSGTSAAVLTGCWQTVDDIRDHMLHFLENHDEQRIASPQFAGRTDTVLPALVASATFDRGPMMIYMGQELGEPGTDAEGYSGRDGRTTIFDYWSIEKIRRHLAKGTCRGRLTEEEKKLRRIYADILHLCNDSPAIRTGAFYDLMYVNYDNPGINPHYHYAYMRGDGTETFLIVCNFGSSEAEVAVRIPRAAFDYLHIRPGCHEASELLSRDKGVLELRPDEQTKVVVPAHSAVLWQIKDNPRK